MIDIPNLLLNAALYVIPFLLVLMLVVVVHELGHFLAARWLGVEVDRFSIGFGKAIASWRDRAGVEWRVGWLPLGGYVRFAGDANAASSVPDREELDAFRNEITRRRGAAAVGDYFHFKPLWVRAIVVAAGPAANFLLAIAIFAVMAATLGTVMSRPRVAAVMPGTPAAAAGFRPGDLIQAIDGRAIADYGEVQAFVQLRAGERASFLVQRGAERRTLTAALGARTEQEPFTGRPITVGFLGVARTNDAADTFRKRFPPAEAFALGVTRVGDIIGTTVFYLGRVVTGRASPDQLGGPLRIAQVSGGLVKASAQGQADPAMKLLSVAATLLGWVGVLSVSIGFTNLLPIPVLDGGHLVFYAYEALARRPVSARMQAAGTRLGLALLLGLMLFATWNDVQPMRLINLLGGSAS